MGKIRVKTIGDEETEKEQKQELKKRKDARLDSARKAKNFENKEDAAAGKSGAVLASPEGKKQSHKKPEEQENPIPTEQTKPQEQKKKKEKFVKKKASPRSSKYNVVAAQVDKKKIYSLREALEILPKLKTAKFDETVELHINTIAIGINGNVDLPYGTGKQTRVVIVDATKDPKAADDLVKSIESGKIDFDVLVATPDSMSRLAKVARYLGPKGLMPNPKNGTVTTKPEEVAKKYAGGQVHFKTEAKFPILHMAVGKVSFGEEKLFENITAAINAIQEERIKEVTLKSTMSPAVRIK